MKTKIYLFFGVAMFILALIIDNAFLGLGSLLFLSFILIRFCYKKLINFFKSKKTQENLNSSFSNNDRENVIANKDTNIQNKPSVNLSIPTKSFNTETSDLKFDSYVVIDIETTGLNRQYDEITEIAGLKVVNGDIVETFNSLIKINGIIPDNVMQLTHITNEMVQNEGREANIVIQEFKRFIGNETLIGHNIPFDISFLNVYFNRYLNISLDNEYIDTLKLSKSFVKNCMNYKLSTMCDVFGIMNDNAHRAYNDVIATNALYRNLKEFTTSKNVKDLNQKVYTTELLDKKIEQNNIFQSKLVVVTGEFQKITRKQVETIITNLGGIVWERVTQKTNILVYGTHYRNNLVKNGTSNKQIRAQELINKGFDIKLISEEDFYNIIEKE